MSFRVSKPSFAAGCWSSYLSWDLACSGLHLPISKHTRQSVGEHAYRTGRKGAPMRRTRILLTTLCLLTLATSVQAQWAVIDVNAIAQLAMQYKAQLDAYVEQIRQTANQVQQIQNQLQQIQYAYT